MDEGLQIKLKNDLVVASLDGEGLVFETDTRDAFWLNQAAALILEVLERNRDGVSFSSLEDLLQERYLVDDERKITQDLASFIGQLECRGLVSLQSPSNGSNGSTLKDPTAGPGGLYLKPMIKREADSLTVIGASVRAGRMASARSAAVSRATAAGFRGFKTR